MVKKRSTGLYQRREYKDDELVNLGFRAKARLVEAVHKAAEKEKARSTSAWLHHVVLEATAKTLGVDPATLDEDRRPAGPPAPSPEAVAQAAQLNALLIDVQERLAKMGVPPAAEAKTTRRR
jgi:hypothetical protein